MNGGVNSIGQRKGVQATFDLGTGVTGNTGSTSWNYDDLGQLTSAATPVTDNNRAYQYDGIGNRIEAREGVTSVTGTANYAANALNQYTAVPYSPPAPTYDGDGNMETGPLKGGSGIASGTLVWDAENRLIRADVGGVTVTYAYDHHSRLISRSVGVPPTSTTRYLYDGWNRIAEYSGQDLQKTYLWGLDISGTQQGAGGVGGLLSVSQEGSVFYPTYDGNGNVSEYLTAAGAVAAHFEYDPFGNTVVSTDTINQFAYRFSTKPIDSATGLCYYGYRWYDPLTGRWPSRDPIGEDGGMNLYGYVGNDAVSVWDILGLKWTVVRNGEARAAVCGEKGDSVATLATDQGHNLGDYNEWLLPTDGKGPAPMILSEMRGFSIPNVWIHANLLRDGKTMFDVLVELGPVVGGILKSNKDAFKLVEPTTPNELDAALLHFGSSLYGFRLFAHGSPEGRITSDRAGNRETHQRRLLELFSYINYRVPVIRLNQCYSLFRGLSTVRYSRDINGDLQAEYTNTPITGGRLGTPTFDPTKPNEYTITNYYDWETPWYAEGVSVTGYTGVNVLGIDTRRNPNQ